MSILALIKFDSKLNQQTQFVLHRIQWGCRRTIFGNELRDTWPGVGYDAVSLCGGTGPHRVKYYDQERYPNQGWTCIGCPHLLMDVKYNSPYCAHPHYVEMYGCPQSVADNKTFSAPPDCPMLGAKSELAQRRRRWHHKSYKIFWHYYHDAGISPYAHGFTIYRP